jgi:drug/metabolite transporter (DMT)-like permease
MQKPTLRPPRGSAFWQMHFSIFLFGFTGILGGLISISPLWLVWWRMGFAGLGFGLMMLYVYRKGDLVMPFRAIPTMIGVGLVLAIHWILFYASIRLTDQKNVSIAVVMLATSPVITALLEPLVRRRRILAHELLLGVFAVVGIYLLHQVSFEYLPSILTGLASAAFSALYGILNKPLVSRYRTVQLNFYQITGAWLFLSVLIPVYVALFPDDGFVVPQGIDWLWLGLLTLVCTNLAYMLSIGALRSVPVFSYILAVNLEPLYTIALAWVLLGERHIADYTFALGTLLVVGSVFAEPVIRKLLAKKEAVAQP